LTEPRLLPHSPTAAGTLTDEIIDSITLALCGGALPEDVAHLVQQHETLTEQQLLQDIKQLLGEKGALPDAQQRPGPSSLAGLAAATHPPLPPVPVQQLHPFQQQPSAQRPQTQPRGLLAGMKRSLDDSAAPRSGARPAELPGATPAESSPFAAWMPGPCGLRPASPPQSAAGPSASSRSPVMRALPRVQPQPPPQHQQPRTSAAAPPGASRPLSDELEFDLHHLPPLDSHMLSAMFDTCPSLYVPDPLMPSGSQTGGASGSGAGAGPAIGGLMEMQLSRLLMSSGLTPSGSLAAAQNAPPAPQPPPAPQSVVMSEADLSHDFASLDLMQAVAASSLPHLSAQMGSIPQYLLQTVASSGSGGGSGSGSGGPAGRASSGGSGRVEVGAGGRLPSLLQLNRPVVSGAGAAAVAVGALTAMQSIGEALSRVDGDDDDENKAADDPAADEDQMMN